MLIINNNIPFERNDTLLPLRLLLVVKVYTIMQKTLPFSRIAIGATNLGSSLHLSPWNSSLIIYDNIIVLLVFGASISYDSLRTCSSFEAQLDI